MLTNASETRLFEPDCGARRVGSRRDCWGQPSNSLFAFGAGLWGLLAACNALLGCPKPIHCKVSDLWDVRDFWKRLAPGYTNQSTRGFALANAAFTSYIGLQKFREFKLEADSSSKEG